MELTNSFSVPLPVGTVWPALLDVERIAPCLPGASVDRIDGDDVHGSVRVKLGPISMRYQGVMTFTERDEAAHRAVMSARAQEARGGGSVSATITAGLTDRGGATDVTVVTDLDITGKPAQFGRGVIADVSNQIMGQFANNLSRALAAEQSAPPASIQPVDGSVHGSSANGSGPAAPAPAVQRPAPVTPVADAGAGLDVLSLIKEPAKRALPPLALGLLIGLLLGRLGRRRTGTPAVTVVPLFGGQFGPQ
jgi:carbon monoxide dehydrogenase subunit G